MTALERLGLGMAAAIWMETPLTEGRLLAALIEQPGKVLSPARLDELMKSPVRTRGVVRIESAVHASSRVRAYVSRIRSALEDLGFRDLIRTAAGDGYYADAVRSAAVRAAIEGAVS